MSSTLDFLTALLPDLGGGILAELRHYDQPGAWESDWLGSPGALLKTALSRSQQGREVYFGVSARRGRKGTKDHVAVVAALHLDLDVPFDEAMQTVETFSFPPSAIVKSGGGAHVYWLLREPFTTDAIEDRNRVERITRGLAYCIPGADHGAWDIGRVLRVPGTMSRKRGVLVELAEFHPDRRYNLSDFEELGIELPPAAEAVAFAEDADASAALGKAGKLPAKVRTLIAEGHTTGSDRSKGDYGVVCALVRVGLTDDEVRAIFQTYPIGEKYGERGEGDRYLALTLSRARADVKAKWEQRGAAVHLEQHVAASTNGSAPAPASVGEAALMFPGAAWSGVFSDYLAAMGGIEAPPEHHFGTLATVVAWLLGRRVFTVYAQPLYPTMYSVLVGDTGSTKKTSTMRRGIDDLALAVVPDAAYITAIGSAEGLMETLATAGMTPLQRRLYEAAIDGRKVNEDGEPDQKGEIPDVPPPPSQGRILLAAPEEWASMLSKAKQEGAGNLTPIITQAYDNPARLNPPTRSKRIVAVAPTLSILTASAPVWVEQFLGVGELISGFCNRFCFWLGPPSEPVPWPSPPQQEPLTWVRRALHESLQRWSGAQHEFALSPEAERLWPSWYATHRARLSSYTANHAAVVTRSHVFAIKLALIFAALRNEAAVIEADDLERGCLVADYLEAAGGALLGTLGDRQTREMKLEARLREIGQAGEHVQKYKLHRRVGGRYTASEVDRCIEALVTVGAWQQDGEGRYFDPRLEAEQVKG